jgi:release factor glutamine methyltransferase
VAADLRRRFAAAGIESAATDADALVCRALGWDRSRLLSRAGEPLPGGAAEWLAGAAARREGREPLAYILGEREFWSLPFRVSPGCLIPRPETELLVERAVALLGTGGLTGDAPAPRILDLGTGTGAIGVAVAKELPGASVLASDLSGEALELALENARRNGVADRFEVVRSDLFGEIPEDVSFDAVISNPPYIPTAEIEGLMPEVALFEPCLALDGGPDGMRCLREILRDAPARLKRGGVLLLEMDPGQIPVCSKEMGGSNARETPRVRGASNAWETPRVWRDLAGRDRVLEAVRA